MHHNKTTKKKMSLSTTLKNEILQKYNFKTENFIIKDRHTLRLEEPEYNTKYSRLCQLYIRLNKLVYEVIDVSDGTVLETNTFKFYTIPKLKDYVKKHIIDFGFECFSKELIKEIKNDSSDKIITIVQLLHEYEKENNEQYTTESLSTIAQVEPSGSDT